MVAAVCGCRRSSADERALNNRRVAADESLHQPRRAHERTAAAAAAAEGRVISAARGVVGLRDSVVGCSEWEWRTCEGFGSDTCGNNT